MKIGILTFHDADNYGGVLQAYALQETIKEIEEKVEIINYKQPYIIRNYKIFSVNKSNIYKLIGSIIYNLLSINSKVQKKAKFHNFRKMYLNISKTTYKERNNISGYSTYVVGSDQVWNSTITKCDKTFFLDFCMSGVNKISYAASLGKDVLSKEEKNFLHKNVENLNYISVREDSAVKILSKLTDKKVEQVLDPTLLVNEGLWHNMLCDNKFNYNYILIYRLTPDEEVLKIAFKISKKLNLKVLYIADSLKRSKYGYKYIKGIGPKEFVTLFKNATFIVTNSFHGAAFSIVFKKDFITVPHEKKGTRMISLLNLLKLDDRIITYSDQINDGFKTEIDYKIASKILEQEKEKSFNFLKGSIEGSLRI